MSRTEDFDSEFWSDHDVAQLTVHGRYLYIWSWTNPRCNMSGAYQVTAAIIAVETGLTADEITATFAELEDHRFAYYDGRVLWVRARAKRLRQKHTNIAKSIETHLRKLPAGHPYVRMFAHEYRDSGWLSGVIERIDVNPLETVGRGSVEGHENPDEMGNLATLTRPSAEGPRYGYRYGQGDREEKTRASAVRDLCHLLADLIRRRDPKAKVAPDSEGWLRDMDRLIRIDGRSADEVRTIIEWAQAEPFWQSNILSPSKLRKQFTQLSLKAKGGNGKPALAHTRDFSRFDEAVGA